MRGLNEEELPNFVKLTESKDVEVRFIEYMPFEGNKWNNKKMVPYAEMLDIIQRDLPALEKITDSPNDTSKVGCCADLLTPFIVAIYRSIPTDVPSARIPRAGGIHHVYVGSFLRIVQPLETDGRRQFESVPVWQCRSFVEVFFFL